MPLTLVTGPANAAKAGAVLGPLRERLRERPILVVPAFQDIEQSQRELARHGAVFGARVLRFDALFGAIATSAGFSARRASELQRALVVERAVAAADLRVLAASAQRPGFVPAAVRFITELTGSMIEPARLAGALRRWAGGGPRRRYAEEVARLYERYHEGLDAAGLVDRELFAWRALDALREQPARWGATPVFAYGFDDFTPLELDALETLASPARCGADVTVSLPYEPGREAFRALAGIRERLMERGARDLALEATDDHYADRSRSALHALERGLFGGHSATARSKGVVRRHLAGGERAELELCGSEVLALLRGGTAPGEVAVVFRDPERYASTVEQVFGAYGIPYSIDRSTPLAHSGLGRGLLALLRCAVLDGSAEDLLAYLRTPGLLREPRLADRLEAQVRREGATTAAVAREIWEQTDGRWALRELDRLAAARDASELLKELDRNLVRLFENPYRRLSHVLEGPEREDARAFRAAHAALAELHALARPGRISAPERRRIHDVLAELPVRVGEGPQPDRVQVASPLEIRARRYAAVLVCGMQAEDFPRRAAPDAFLPDSDRREINRVTGLGLPLREDQLERERYLFYVCASRAERELVLSCRSSDEEGNLELPSFFLDEVRAVLPDLDDHTRARSLADVAWEPSEAPTAAEWERSLARAGPRRTPDGAGAVSADEALAELGEWRVVSAGALERFAGCPVRWLVEDVLKPETLEPDPEQMVRGRYAHSVLELTFRRLRESTGARGVTPGNLPAAERILLGALEELRGELRVSPSQVRVRAAVRRLEFDLLRYLRHESERDGLFAPEHLELRFGLDGDAGHPAVELERDVLVRGVIDRVDTYGQWALVRDYKSGRASRHKVSDWEAEGRFQVALYMLVVQRMLGLRPAGGVYVPLSGTERRSRGLVAEELREELGGDFFANDFKAQSEFDRHTEWARTAIVGAARRMRTGAIEPCPERCAYRGGCSHPSICRAEG